MKSFLLPLCAVLALSFTSTSCKKDKTEDPKPKTRTEMLTAGDWKVTAATLTSGGITDDLYAAADACDKDDLTKFNTGGVAVFKTGAIKCTPTEADYNGAWGFMTNDTKLILTDPQSVPSILQLDVVELTDTRLQLRGVLTDSSFSGTYNVTYTK